jgi:hypothetical protein
MIISSKIKLGFKHIYRVKLDIQQLRNPAFGDNSTGTGDDWKGRNIQILPNLVHDFFIGLINLKYKIYIFFSVKFKEMFDCREGTHDQHKI